MSIKTLLCAVAASMLVLGCAGPTTGPERRVCAPPSCDVVVTVEKNSTTGKLEPKVDSPTLTVKHGSSPVIVWKLQTSGYEFRADSISPYRGATTPTKSTTPVEQWNSHITFLNIGSGREYRVRNTNSNRSTNDIHLYYNVKVYSVVPGAPDPDPLDPVIINEGL